MSNKKSGIKLPFIGVLALVTVPLAIALIVAVLIGTSEMKSSYSTAEELYYDNLYQIATGLINADRDFYQASYSAMQYHEIKNGNADLPADQVDSYLTEKLSEYNENTQQTIDGVNEVIAMAKQNPDLYTGTTVDGDSTTFEQYANTFLADYAVWQSDFDLESNSGSWNDFMTDFSSTRGALSSMCDIVEAWAEEEDASENAIIDQKVLLIFVIFIVIIVVIVAFSVFVMMRILKSFKSMDASVTKMANGDFITPVDDSSFINEFGRIGSRMDGMRRKLQESLLQVVSLAGNVDDGANTTQMRIADSQRMSADISSAVTDLANGATSMAQDVQSTSDLTINIGNSVESVMNSTTTNNDNGKMVYQNAETVKDQLEKLKVAGETTDGMATQVADSVNETAAVVDKISQAAEAIIGIASQTNLLALNASIEAARAGEAGKGFAVVADNIKNLAEESDGAAKQITEMLSQIVTLSNQNKELTAKIKEATANEAGELQEMEASFDEMLELLVRTEEGNAAILTLVQSLNTDKDSVMNSVESLSSISQQNAASTEETSASLEQLSNNMEDVVEQAVNLQKVAGDLQESIRFFRVSEDAADTADGEE